MKLWFQALPLPYAQLIPDLALYYSNSIFFAPLPPALMALGEKYDHHIVISAAEFGGGEMARVKQRVEAFVNNKVCDTASCSSVSCQHHLQLAVSQSLLPC